MATSDDEKSERSRRYPSASVRDAIVLLEGIHKGLGLNGGSRDSLAQAMGHTTLNGASARKIATLIQYGLLDRDGERYRVSGLGRKLLIPVHEKEKIEAVAEAVRTPALYRELGESLDQQPIPVMLANVLAREHGVLSLASNDVAKNFLESVEFAGILGKDGVLRWQLAGKPIEVSPPNQDALLGTVSTDLPPIDTKKPVLLSDVQAREPASGLVDYSIPLDGRGRKAIIHLPNPIIASDLRRIISWIDFMKIALTESEKEMGLASD